MTTDAETPIPWYESLTPGQMVCLAFLKIDRAGWTDERKNLPEDAAKEKTRRYREGITYVARACDAAQPSDLRPHGDGYMLFFHDGAAPAPVAAFRAAKALWSEFVAGQNLPVRIAVHTGLVPWNPKLGEIDDTAVNLCGHLEGAAPVNSVAVTEGVYLSLSPAERSECAPRGVTRRDGIPAYAYPAAMAGKREAGRFLETDDLRYWESFRRYCEAPEIAKVRFPGLGERNPPSLDLEQVFVAQALKTPPMPGVRILAQSGISASEFQALARAGVAAVEGDAQARSWFEARGGVVVEQREIPVGEAIRQNRSLLILGDPGSGKTTLLRWLALVALSGPYGLWHALGIWERLLPLPVSVGRLAEVRGAMRGTPSVLDALVRYFHGREVGAGLGGEAQLRSFLRRRLEAGECLVLLDGLDEVGNEERASIRSWLEAFAAQFPKNRLVASSRVVGFPGFAVSGSVDATLRPFDHAQVEQYVRAFTRAYRAWELRTDDSLGAREHAERLLQAIRGNPRLNDLARNPFLLSSLALIHRARGAMPRHRVLVYHEFAKMLCETWGQSRRLVAGPERKEIGYAEEALPILGRLALRMHEEYPSGVAPRDFVVKTLAEALRDRRSLAQDEAGRAAEEFLRRAGEEVQILQERGKDAWGFMHLSFQEFFAAAGLHAEGEFEKVALKRLFDPRWEEVIRLGVGYMALVQGRTKPAADFVDRVFKHREKGKRAWITKVLRKQIPLAALLAAEAGDALPRGLQEEIAREFVAWALEMPQEISQGLAEQLAPSDLRPLVANQLRSRLARGSAVPRHWALALLAVVEKANATQELVSALNDHEVAREAAFWIGRLKLSEAIPVLLDRLGKEQEEFVRLGIYSALGEMKDRRAVPVLVERFRSGEDCSRAAAALAVVDPARAQDVFLKALGHQDKILREAAAAGLGKLPEPVSEDLLLQTLNDPERGVHRAALRALGRFVPRSAKATEAVRRELHADDPDSRVIAADILVAIQPAESAEVLSQLLDYRDLDNSGLVCLEALSVLRRLPSETVVPLLDGFIRDSLSVWRGPRRPSVRGEVVVRSAIRLLAETGSKPTIAALREARKRAAFREAALVTLARLGDRSAVKAVRGKLTRSIPLWFNEAFEALRRRDPGGALKTLVSALSRSGGMAFAPDARGALWKLSLEPEGPWSNTSLR